MKKISVKVIKEDSVSLPIYMTDGSAGMDVHAYLKEDIIIKPFERVLVPTGLKVEIPLGYEIQVRPRSGLALKKGITVINAPGTLDSDYKGDVGVILINHGTESFEITNNTAIAQLVLQESIIAEYEEISELSETARGEGGFGHTGNM